MKSYLEKVLERPIVLDGAMGTMLYEKGVFVNACYDELSLTRPDLILEIHREYAAAGADLLLTNTFGANRMKLSEFGLGDKVAQMNAQAVLLARTAADGIALVAGDVGPCSGFRQALTTNNAATVASAFVEQMAALKAAGVDVIFLETFSDLKELQLAAGLARATGLPVHASFTVNENGETALGFTVETIIEALERDPSVDTIGLNCAIGPAGVFDLVDGIVKRMNKPLLVKPNAGLPREVGGRMLYMTSPEYFTEYAKRFIERGVRGFGGCCGTTPAHIRMAAKTVKSLSGVKHHATIKVFTEEEKRAVTVVPPSKKSRFAERLLRGEKVTSVELLPPKAPDMTALFEKVRQCHAAGVDAINIPDGPRASARVSPMITSVLIKNATGIEPIPHYCCRDRNLLGMQSDILGAYAAGLTNLLVITGDPPKTGEYPDITGVFDVDAIGLTQMIHNLNHGRDLGGNLVQPPTAIFIGVGANPSAIDVRRELDRTFRKIEAGAEYAITQPVFDADSLLRFLDEIDTHLKRIPVIAGVWPLVSYKNAEFMRNEVPGVVIPDSVMERLAACKTKEEGQDTGIEIAHEIMARIASRVAGFQVSAPMGNVQMALRVLGKA